MAGGRRYVTPPLKWADIGLIALGVVALIVVVLAIRSGSTAVSGAPGTATPGTGSTTLGAGASGTDTPGTGTPSPSKSTSPSKTPTSPKTPTPTASAVQKAVFLGDGFTAAGATGKSWATLVSQSKGWQETNLSVAGMGYLATPASCPQPPCSNFAGMVSKVVASKPTVVVVAGGNADGDQDVAPAATSLFKALRAALPDARIIAVSPLSGYSAAPSWLKAHGPSIKAAVTSVQGEYLDLGQPLTGKPDLVVGNGLPSAEGHQTLADAVLERLK